MVDVTAIFPIRGARLLRIDVWLHSGWAHRDGAGTYSPDMVIRRAPAMMTLECEWNSYRRGTSETNHIEIWDRLYSRDAVGFRHFSEMDKLRLRFGPHDFYEIEIISVTGSKYSYQTIYGQAD